MRCKVRVVVVLGFGRAKARKARLDRAPLPTRVGRAKARKGAVNTAHHHSLNTTRPPPVHGSSSITYHALGMFRK